jgi:hypothetical protein
MIFAGAWEQWGKCRIAFADLSRQIRRIALKALISGHFPWPST